MPPTLLPEEIPSGPQAQLTSSKKWVVQVGLLFGLLLLGRGSRQLPAQLAAIKFPVPALLPGTTPPVLMSEPAPGAVAQEIPLKALPVGYPAGVSAGVSAAFAGIGL